MKKKFTTIMLALLMTIMFATAGVFAVPDGPEIEEKGNNHWKVTVDEENDVTDTSAVIVWNPTNKEYEYSEDAVFSIYMMVDGKEELMEKDIVSIDKKEDMKDPDAHHYYVYNNEENKKTEEGDLVPLGYSYKIENLTPGTEYELIVKEKNDKEDDQIANNSANFKTSPAETNEKTLRTAVAGYTLSNPKVTNITNTTALFTWSMSPEFTSGQVTINGRIVNPKNNGDGTYSYTVSGLNPARSYSLPVKVIDGSGKDISNELRVSVSTAYSLSAGKVTSTTATTAMFNWRMNRELTDGSRVTINNRVVNPKKNSDGTYSYNVSGLNPARKYSLPVKVIDKNGKTVSNVMNIAADTSYKLSAGKVASRGSQSTAVFNWRMNQALSNGARLTINGRVVNPKKNDDGTYSYNVSGLNPAKSYVLPVKVIDKYGNTISNVLNVTVKTYFVLWEGKVTGTTATTAMFNWKMNRELANGERLTINGRVVNPKRNDDGTYSYNVSGLNPARKYSLPVKVIDKNGKVISNVLNIAADTSCKLSAGKVTSRPSTTTAVFNWRMNYQPSGDARVTINNRVINPAKNSDGTYSYTVSGLDPAKSYKLPVKIIDKNGNTISNVLNISVGTYFTVSAGKVASKSGTSAVFNWKMSRDLSNGEKVSINGHPVIPTKNADGTFSYNVTGFKQGNIYNIPVKVIDSSGKTISNTIYVEVDMFGEKIKTMQLRITFGETVTLTDHSDGRTTTTFRSGFTTTTVGSEGNEDTGGFYYFNYNGKLYRVKWTRISSVSIASSAFDKTYSGAVAQNYVNSLNISSSTGVLIWVNTYTQKEYIFTGSRNNWRLVAGPWSVTTGKASTPTQTGLGTITDKDPEQNGLPYWSVVYTFSFHGKLSSWSLGYPQSNGCVRNSNDHAYYIYGSCPIGTTVYVY